MGSVLAASEEMIARDGVPLRRRALGGTRRGRRESAAERLAEAAGGYTTGRQRTGLRLTFHGGLPASVWGKVASGAALLVMAALIFVGGTLARRLMLHDQRFVVTSPSEIVITGQHHLTRAQVLGTMGNLVGRNIFSLSLDRERASLEQMPWVEHATLMRLLPDHLSANIVERAPVAFARNGGRVELVDANGVLLDMTAGERYSFPVVTGISPDDPASVRAARMRIFAEFTAALDATNEHISSKLSEIDLSNPEDVKAVIPKDGADVLVHFGDSDYLERYRRFAKLLPEWRAQYPKLAGADMRYEQQVVLDMQRGTGAPLAGTSATVSSDQAARATAPSTSKQAQSRIQHALSVPSKSQPHAAARKRQSHPAVQR